MMLLLPRLGNSLKATSYRYLKSYSRSEGEFLFSVKMPTRITSYFCFSVNHEESKCVRVLLLCNSLKATSYLYLKSYSRSEGQFLFTVKMPTRITSYFCSSIKDDASATEIR